jgi:hypothetical protein
MDQRYWLRLQNTYNMMEARFEVGKPLGKIKLHTIQKGAYA